LLFEVNIFGGWGRRRRNRFDETTGVARSKNKDAIKFKINN
jgi:hypothetical protein